MILILSKKQYYYIMILLFIWKGLYYCLVRYTFRILPTLMMTLKHNFQFQRGSRTKGCNGRSVTEWTSRSGPPWAALRFRIMTKGWRWDLAGTVYRLYMLGHGHNMMNLPLVLGKKCSACSPLGQRSMDVWPNLLSDPILPDLEEPHHDLEGLLSNVKV